MKTNNEIHNWANSEKCQLMSHKIRNVVDHVKEHFSQDLKLAVVGLRFGYHPDYLCRKFKKEMGIPFHEFILKVRVQKAICLLMESEKGIKEISFEVGFSRPEVFSRAFRRMAGCSPREFRNHYPVLGKGWLGKGSLTDLLGPYPSISHFTSMLDPNIAENINVKK
ncbi:MAG TPA: AraC family transcriptional regulator [Nitrospiria bacterium]|jgi:AraC-like DNA-binding protein